MKTKYLLLAIACLMVFSAQAQSKKELRKQKAAEEFAETRRLVESGNFRFDGVRAQTTGGRSIDLSGRFGFAEISNGSARADLPFFGRAGNVGYSEASGGIEFDGVMEGITLSVNEKKNRITLTFSVRSGREQYQCIFNVTGRHSAMLGITSNLRSQISYDGRLSAITKGN